MFGEPRLGPAPSPLMLATACAVAGVVAGAGLCASAAAAQSRVQAEQPQRERTVGRGLAATGRYMTDGGEAFVLDHSGSRALLRFADSSEVWVLRASPAPRGDILYRNDAGEVVLRSTPSGGLTLFTPRTPGGQPASQVGPATGLERPSLSPMQLVRFLIQQSGLVSDAVGHLIVFDAAEISPGSETLVAEAASAAVEALTRMARAPNLRDKAQRVRRIVIVEEDANDVRFSDGALTIAVQPGQGAAGRPSSSRVVRVLAERPAR